MKFILSGILFSLMFISHHVLMASEIATEDLILHFDDVQRTIKELHFKDDTKIKPEKGVFEIIEKYLMSNGLGERWAVVTIKNTSAGKRLLKNENIVATHADGSQSNAQNIDETLDGNDILTKAVLFRVHRFPILTIEVR